MYVAKQMVTSILSHVTTITWMCFPTATQPYNTCGKKLGAFTIWIDAIWIDSSNAGEKESKIPHIVEIYSKADVVYVWFGEGSPRTSRAMADLDLPPFLEYFLSDHGIEHGMPAPRP